LKLVLTSALIGALFLISGCGTQCDSVCAQFNTCKLDSNPPERFVYVDCANFCSGVDAVNQRAGGDCKTQWTAHLTCWQQNRNEICNTDFDGCDETAADWATCVDTYCAGLAADEYDPACFDGAIVFISPFQSGF
jgi:hypothetical protein